MCKSQLLFNNINFLPINRNPKHAPKQDSLNEEQVYSYQQGEIRYTTDYRYKGEIKNKKRHGKGEFFNNKGELLVSGQWQDDLPHGEVLMRNDEIDDDVEFPYSYKDLTRKDWVKFEGVCIQGAKSGQGVIYYQNGDRFIGNFSDDQVKSFGNLGGGGI